MLIRFAENKNITEWQNIAAEVALLFNSPNMPNEDSFIDYMKRKIERYEAIIALDRMTNNILGIIGFSRKNNRISWFAVKSTHRSRGIGSRLLQCAINQLDWQRDISAITFNKNIVDGLPARRLYTEFGFIEVDGNVVDDDGNTNRCKMVKYAVDKKKGGSFHYDYIKYKENSKAENCPPCRHDFMVLDGHERIAELEYSYTDSRMEAQGALFGKCTISPKYHIVNFEDMPKEQMIGFMNDVQIIGKALMNVTKAIKINYEMHSNSGPHLHIHIFPRYLDDNFPSAPIDFSITEPLPYESEEEFNWFVQQMREEVGKLVAK